MGDVRVRQLKGAVDQGQIMPIIPQMGRFLVQSEQPYKLLQTTKHPHRKRSERPRPIFARSEKSIVTC